MKNHTFKLIIFFVAFVAGTIAVAFFWQFRQPQVEVQMPEAMRKSEASPSPVLQTVALDYDKVRYEKIKSTVESIIESKKENGVLKMPFTQASKQLSLKDVKWGKGYSNKPGSELRIYHFRGFYLILPLEKRMPNNTPSWTFKELEQRGVLSLYYFHPAVHVDGLNDPKERMRLHWKSVFESLQKRNEKMQKQRESDNPKQ